MAADAKASRAKSPCKVQAACGPPEARQLRLGQRLGQLEDARHVRAAAAVAGQIAAVEAASEGGEHLSAS